MSDNTDNTQPLDFPKAMKELAEKASTLPTWYDENPRFGLYHSSYWALGQDNAKTFVRDGVRYRKHTCWFTDQDFALPEGAPVPVVFYEVYRDGELDGGWEYHALHPSIAAEGIDGIRRAMRAFVEGRIKKARNELEWAIKANHLLKQEIEQEWPAYWQNNGTDLENVLEL